MTEDTNLSVGDSVSLSFSSGEESDHFYLPISYVRQENGRYYVMKKSKENTLEKQTVQTGKIVYGGYSIEIISGIDSSDEICFPYGKYVAEGILNIIGKTRRSSRRSLPCRSASIVNTFGRGIRPSTRGRSRSPYRRRHSKAKSDTQRI